MQHQGGRRVPQVVEAQCRQPSRFEHSFVALGQAGPFDRHTLIITNGGTLGGFLVFIYGAILKEKDKRRRISVAGWARQANTRLVGVRQHQPFIVWEITPSNFVRYLSLFFKDNCPYCPLWTGFTLTLACQKATIPRFIISGKFADRRCQGVK